MGLFKKKKKEEEKEISELPELPKLPEFSENETANSFERPVDTFREGRTELEEQVPRLPSFPNSSTGNKFSQDTIKEAVSGKREVNEAEADEFEQDEQTMPSLPIKRETKKSYLLNKGTEPIFIRIDKFEDGSRTFEEVKNQISEIENMLEELKMIKEKEEKELEFWEGEIKKIKTEMEKIDRNIFSKV